MGNVGHLECAPIFMYVLLYAFQDYTITMYLNQYWRDERLAFNAFGPYYDDDADDDGVNDVLTLSGDFAEKIWVPDTFFANDKNR